MKNYKESKSKLNIVLNVLIGSWSHKLDPILFSYVLSCGGPFNKYVWGMIGGILWWYTKYLVANYNWHQTVVKNIQNMHGFWKLFVINGAN